jgi:predicted metal-dependent phosphoesterase TrpH
MSEDTAAKETSLIRADLHMHTWCSPDSILSPRALVERALRAGLTCVAVTDHNTIRGALAVREIAPPQLRVIVGEEVRSAEGELLGLFIEEEVPRGLTVAETIQRIKAQGGLVGIPHPFDPLRAAVRAERLGPLMSEVDFVEGLNARIIFGTDNKKAVELARRYQLPVTAASDAHSAREVGRCYVEMPAFSSPAEFLDSLRRGVLHGRLSSPFIHWISRFAAVRHRLGWNPG